MEMTEDKMKDLMKKLESTSLGDTMILGAKCGILAAFDKKTLSRDAFVDILSVCVTMMKAGCGISIYERATEANKNFNTPFEVVMAMFAAAGADIGRKSALQLGNLIEGTCLTPEEQTKWRDMKTTYKKAFGKA